MSDISAAATTTKAPMFFQRRFFPMWTALCLGAFTDNMLKQALLTGLVYGVLVAPLIGNDTAAPIIGALFPISMLLFSTIAGQFADKFETSFMFRRTKLVELVLMTIAAIGFLTSNSLILILVLFLMGAQSAFFSPVRTGAMPKYLAPDELVRGNALCSGGLFVSVMIGIVLGNVLIETEFARSMISVILITAAFLGWIAIRFAPEAPANAPELKIDWNGFAQGAQLARYVIDGRGVLRPVLGVAWYWSVGALVSVSIPFFVRETLHADPTVVAAFMGLFTVGAAVGAGIAASLAKKTSGLQHAGFAAITAALMMIAVYILSITYNAPRTGNFQNVAAFFDEWRAWTIAGAFLISSISMSVFAIPMMAAVQRRAPADKRSRILAANNMVNAAGAFLGSLLVLSITETGFRPQDMFLALAFAQGGLATYMFVRKARVPAGLYDEMLSEQPSS